jgi:hypothetical protein
MSTHAVHVLDPVLFTIRWCAELLNAPGWAGSISGGQAGGPSLDSLDFVPILSPSKRLGTSLGSAPSRHKNINEASRKRAEARCEIL